MEDPGRKTTGELMRDVADDVQLLVRKELELARVELQEGLRAQLKGAGLIAIAVLALLPGLLFLVISLAIWLGELLPGTSRAAGFAIVGGVLLAFTGIGMLIGVRIARSRRPSVGAAVDQMKEDVRWARERIAR